MTPRLRPICRCTFTFHVWRRAGWKSGATDAGDRPAARAVFTALSRRMRPAKVNGTARGGLAAVGVTTLVTGWSRRRAYAARTDVLPSLNGSQTTPTRGWNAFSLG